MDLRIPFATMVKVALFLLLVAAVIKLRSFIAIVYVAAMLAVVMAAATERLQSWHVPRGVALTIVVVVTFGAMIAFLFWVVPTMFAQVRGIVADAPNIAARLEKQLPRAAPYIKSVAAQIHSRPSPTNMTEWLSRGAMAGWIAIEMVTAIFLTLVMAVYFVVEGKRALAWLFSFAPDGQRRKLVQTSEEVEPVMRAYMRGQLITSSLAGAVAFVTLLLLHVPAAVPLAVLAFVGDFIPVLGFIGSVVPALLLALLVSPIAPLIVLGAYAAYHVVENYYVVPRIYGRSLRLSTLTVLVSVSAGGILVGPVGAVLILPIIAAYPAVERIWLRPHLAPDTVPKHDAIEGDDDAKADRVADDILNP
ncbi:MAG TPA: AI-2E family transporter [Thermoanaerobaculia bacterium]|nr:AI-2E family transporter [Thermoanaerobaculia bacterium]